ncbi:MAG: GlsB/YeaQ/YmgE family stress response membrane protein [Actinomycetota bacterium]|nr:GlsB/YeaQ/YmgE family stress response membrane protein [Actinomycetota bacterium]
MIVTILFYIVVGLIVGALARLILPGRDPIGIIGTIILGIIGALLGGFLWQAIFGPNKGVSWIGSVIVAVILLAIYRQMTYRRSGTAFTR